MRYFRNDTLVAMPNNNEKIIFHLKQGWKEISLSELSKLIKKDEESDFTITKKRNKRRS